MKLVAHVEKPIQGEFPSKALLTSPKISVSEKWSDHGDSTPLELCCVMVHFVHSGKPALWKFSFLLKLELTALAVYSCIKTSK